jgi:cytoskeletal protein CcmA (bactofilin family)
MWKSRPDDKPVTERPSPQPGPAPFANPASVSPASLSKDTRAAEPSKTNDTFRVEVAHIGKSVKVKGELSGSEDLYFDGEVEGSVDLCEHTLTVGPNGRIRANILAREIIVHGKIEGNLRASEKVELKKSCVLTGDISTQRIVIEDGAFFRGAIDIQKDGKPELKKAAIAVSADTTAMAASSPQVSLLHDE